MQEQQGFTFPGQTAFHKGKVRDSYIIGDRILVSVTSNRVSAYDHVLPVEIPHKGQVLNQIAQYFLGATNDIVPNWMLSSPHPQITIGYYCKPFLIEMVVRKYLCGSMWKDYKAGVRWFWGKILPEGMSENDTLPNVMCTPTNKAKVGHDEKITREEIIKQGLATPGQYDQLEAYSLALFERGTVIAIARGLILVDTKYEFGLLGNDIYLIDEVHTPDSSRYFYSEGFTERQARHEPQKQLSKEFLREWLRDNGFEGKDGQVCPDIPEDVVDEVSKRYVDLYQKVTGIAFEPQSLPEEGDPAFATFMQEEIFPKIDMVVA